MRQEAEPATTEVDEVAPGILRMQLPLRMPGLGHVNCYAMEDERGWTIVDPGMPGRQPWSDLLGRLDQCRPSFLGRQTPDAGDERSISETEGRPHGAQTVRTSWRQGGAVNLHAWSSGPIALAADGPVAEAGGDDDDVSSRQLHGLLPLEVDAEFAVPAEEELVFIVVMPGELPFDANDPNDRLVDVHQIAPLPRAGKRCGRLPNRDLSRGLVAHGAAWNVSGSAVPVSADSTSMTSPRRDSKNRSTCR